MFDPFYRHRVKHRIAGLRVELKLLQIRLALKANFNPLQPRDSDGEWIKVGFEDDRPRDLPSGRTGDPKIDRTTDDLVEIAQDVANNVRNLNPLLAGTEIHANFAKAVRELNLPGIGKDGVETSFSLGDMVRYGFKDGIRTDVIKRDGRTASAPIIAVWDVKTGGARLTPKRVREIRTHLGIDESVPIFEISIVRGVSRKSHNSNSLRPDLRVIIGGLHVS